MKIAFVTYEYPPKIEGGAGIYAENIVKQLSSKGVTVKVITPCVEKEQQRNCFENIELHEVPVRSQIPFTAPQFWTQAARKLKKLEDEVDVVHVNGLCYSWHTLRPLRLPFVTTIHHTVGDSNRQRSGITNRLKGDSNIVTKLLEKRTIKYSDKIVAVSDHTKKNIQRKYSVDSNNVESIYNGIDHRVDSPDLSELRKNMDQLLFVGRVNDPRKNLDGLLKAISMMDSSLNLEVVGGGNAKSSIELCDQLGIADSVTFHGYVSDDQLLNHYKRSNILVSPSIDEGFGLANLEALQMGCKVVANEVGALPEVIGHLNGVFMNVANNPLSLSRKIEEALESSERPSQNQISQYTWQESTKKTMDVYRNLNRN